MKSRMQHWMPLEYAGTGHYTLILSSAFSPACKWRSEETRFIVSLNDTHSSNPRWLNLNYPSSFISWIRFMTREFTRGLSEVKEGVRALDQRNHTLRSRGYVIAIPLELLNDSKGYHPGSLMGPERWLCCPGWIKPGLKVVIHKDLMIYTGPSCMCSLIGRF